MLRSEPLRVVFATPECAPLVKTGGLGDVGASLPPMLRALGAEVLVLLPGYPQVLAALDGAAPAAALAAQGSFPAARLLRASGAHGVALLVIDCAALYARDGGPYQDAHGRDWPDNALRFGMLSRVAALLGSEATPIAPAADVVHCNDWQAALAPAYLRFDPAARAASLVTIHNLAYQGVFGRSWLGELGLPESSWSPEGLEYYGQLSFLKGGVHYADAITTVSPTYALEIRSEALGFGMHGMFAARAGALSGIVNGIDTEVWNPETDALIESRYGAATLEAKRANKRALQRAFGLPPEDDTPLAGVVSRLVHQKGIDWVAAIAPQLAQLPVQLVLQGQGDEALERELLELARAHPDRIAVRIGFDETLAHRIEAGADLFLMPSRFEPCGMNQMYSQRYGTPPVVHATGGLRDTVVDCNEQTLAAGTASGFTFGEGGATALLDAIRRAVDAYRTPAVWRALQRNGMARDFSWRASAARYLDIYRAIASTRSRRSGATA